MIARSSLYAMISDINEIKSLVSDRYKAKDLDLDIVDASILEIAAMAAQNGLEGGDVQLPVLIRLDSQLKLDRNLAVNDPNWVSFWQELDQIAKDEFKNIWTASFKERPFSAFKLNTSISAKLSLEEIMQLRTNAGTSVARVEYDGNVDIEDQCRLATDMSSPLLLGATELTGEGQTVAVIDGLLDISHPCFGGRASVAWQDVNPAFPKLCQDHATRVGGIIAGNGNGTKGMTPYIGIAPKAAISNFAFTPSLKGSDTSNAQISQALEALEQVASRGIRIINLSWGVTRIKGAAYPEIDGRSALSLAVNELERRGFLVVKSLGNNGELVTIPGDAEGALTVGATTADGSALSKQSGHGPTSDRRMKPEICAPSPFVAPSSEIAEGFSVIDAGFTSFSAPVISGLAALLWQANPEASVQQIKKAIIKSGKKIPHAEEDRMGYGLVSVDKAVSNLTSDNIAGA